MRGMILQLERAARSSTTNSLLCFCCLPLPYLCMHRFFLMHQDHHKLLPIGFVAEVNVRSRSHCEVDAAACVTRADAYARWRSFVLIRNHVSTAKKDLARCETEIALKTNRENGQVTSSRFNTTACAGESVPTSYYLGCKPSTKPGSSLSSAILPKRSHYTFIHNTMIKSNNRVIIT